MSCALREIERDPNFYRFVSRRWQLCLKQCQAMGISPPQDWHGFFSWRMVSGITLAEACLSDYQDQQREEPWVRARRLDAYEGVR